MENIHLQLIAITLLLTISIFTQIMNFKTKTGEGEAKDKSYFKETRFYKQMFKIPLVERIDKFLKTAEYPYGITVEIYLLMNTIAIAAGVFVAIRNFDTLSTMELILQVAKVFIVVMVFPNVIIYMEARKIRQKIQMELCNIQDIVYFQSKIGTTQDVILAYAAKIANEPLKTPLRHLSDRYKYFNNDISSAFNDFRKATNLMEFQAFSFILEQRERTGYSEENHQAQAAMLKTSKRVARRIKREYRRTKLIVASIMMFGCFILFATVPLIKTLLHSVDIILR